MNKISSGVVTWVHILREKNSLPLLIREKRSLKAECRFRKKVRILFVDGFPDGKQKVTDLNQHAQLKGNTAKGGPVTSHQVCVFGFGACVITWPRQI